MTSRIVWEPSEARIAAAASTRFRLAANARFGLALADSLDLHRWSVANLVDFHDLLWDFAGFVGDKGERVFVPMERIEQARFFPDARLNVAENLLKRTGPDDAIVFRGEDGATARLSWDALHALVSRLQQALRAAGVGAGDRVAAYLPNIPEATALLLACASIGAVFCSASPDYGASGAVDRFAQAEPKLFFACDGYRYAGKVHPVGDKVAQIAAALAGTRVVVVPFIGAPEDILAAVAGAMTLSAFLAPFAAGPVTYMRLPFDHPLYILFSSGTTGKPKAIVHRAGAILLQAKEQLLHCDIRAGDRVFYFSTLTWMVWNWHVAVLQTGAAIMLFDGSPFHPGPAVLWDYAADEDFTLFGTSARYLDTVRKSGLRPGDGRDLSSLRMVSSTGSPLAPVNYAFVYEAVKRDVHLASVSGGTDIVGCFVTGDPTRPVRDGEIQGPSLAIDVSVVDEAAHPVPPGVKGELVCATPFPSIPLGFLGDADGSRFRAAYFDRFPGLWHHGDFAAVTEAGGFVIYGRSDATLNAGGVRIGTAEIYAEVERIPEILEALAIGQEVGHDTRIVLFVRPAPGVDFDAAFEKRLRAAIRSGASPRHVPEIIVPVADLPRTKNGKIVELAVRDVVHGRPIGNVDALANPEALELFRDMPELRMHATT
jgi:acetoacetyl-CoA synthetase